MLAGLLTDKKRRSIFVLLTIDRYADIISLTNTNFSCFKKVIICFEAYRLMYGMLKSNRSDHNLGFKIAVLKEYCRRKVIEQTVCAIDDDTRFDRTRIVSNYLFDCFGLFLFENVRKKLQILKFCRIKSTGKKPPESGGQTWWS